MKSKKITWLILAGKKKSSSEPQEWVGAAIDEIVLDLLDRIKDLPHTGEIIVSSNDQAYLDRVGSEHSGTVCDYFDGESFSFYGWLEGIINKYKPEKLFYWGGGASPLVTPEFLDKISSSAAKEDNVLYTNNFFSSDWVAFSPAKAALGLKCVELDNQLSYALWRQAGLKSIYIEPSAEISGDIDTPADLLVLSEIPAAGRRVHSYLKSLNLDTSTVKEMIELLKGRNRIFLSGRVGSSIMRYLDKKCLCGFRIISEERGMRASGRDDRREVISVLGTMSECMGIDGMFSFIESVADGAVIDSRVLFSHICGKVNICDRFYSDLGMYDKIEDGWVKEFTKGFTQAKIPILSGGHSLILGGLWSLVASHAEITWQD